MVKVTVDNERKPYLEKWLRRWGIASILLALGGGAWILLVDRSGAALVVLMGWVLIVAGLFLYVFEVIDKKLEAIAAVETEVSDDPDEIRMQTVNEAVKLISTAEMNKALLIIGFLLMFAGGASAKWVDIPAISVSVGDTTATEAPADDSSTATETSTEAPTGESDAGPGNSDWNEDEESEEPEATETPSG